ncbi:hypothetical protein [Rhodococcus wratislaviensis]
MPTTADVATVGGGLSGFSGSIDGAIETGLRAARAILSTQA